MPVDNVNRHPDSIPPDDGGMRLGDRIRQLREAKKLSVAALARMVGIAQPSLWEIEAGETKTLRADTLMRLAAVLGEDPEYIRTGRRRAQPPVGSGINEQEIIDLWQRLDAPSRAGWVKVGETLLIESGKARTLLHSSSGGNESVGPRRGDSRQRVAQALLDELARILAAYGPDALAGAFAHLQSEAKGTPAVRRKTHPHKA